MSEWIGHECGIAAIRLLKPLDFYIENKEMSAFNSQGKVSATLPQQGTALWNKMPKINAELFALTYGAMVMQLIKDHEDVDAVNK